jgi:cytochrome d ubiquinol oxidase subunit II
MLLLLALIARAVAIEVRSKVDSNRWKQAWDLVFFLGSFLPALLLGVALGNILQGIPIDSSGEYTGGFFGLLAPLPLLCGLLSVVAFTTHGALYLMGKVEDDMRARLRQLLAGLLGLWIILFLVVVTVSRMTVPWFVSNFMRSWHGWVILPLTLLALISIRPLAARGKWRWALVSSGTAIALMVVTVALSIFPMLVPSTTDLDYSLTITNSSSTQRTLTAMLIIAVVGMPLVLGYTVFIYRAFRGPVKLSHDSY